MKLLGRHIGWLGWVVAGVLALSAGGVALAAGSGPSTTSAVTADDPGKAGQGRVGRGLRQRLARRALHGQVTVRTKDGTRTLVVAAGKVTALSGGSVTVTSSDGVATTFSIDGTTRFGFLREPQPRAELKVGDQARVLGTREGDRNLARRVVTGTGP